MGILFVFVASGLATSGRRAPVLEARARHEALGSDVSGLAARADERFVPVVLWVTLAG